MKTELAIFDLDGTVLDTLQDLYLATNFALNTLGFPKRSREEVRAFVGNGIRRLVELAVPEGTNKDDADAVFSAFNEYYALHCADNTKPYDGIKELLLTLKERGIKTAVVSNKADYAVQALCEKYFDGLFLFAVGEREGIRRKPTPDSVNEVLKVLSAPKSKAVYIGDSEVDIKTAKNAGMECISVLWGFRNKKTLTLNGGKVFAETPEEILKYIIR